MAGLSSAERAGVRLTYEVTGDGPPLLLIQGLGYGRWGWEPLAAPLAEMFTVIAFDNRGAGDSDAPPGPYSTETMAADAAAVLDAAGVERAHVMGASLGGMIAQMLAIGHPDRVDRLVLGCTTPGGPDAHPLPAGTVELMRRAGELPPEEASRRFVHNALSEDTLRDRPEVPARILRHRRAVPQDQAAWQAQAAASLGHDAGGRLAGIGARTLVLHGTADQVVDPRNAGLLAGRIPDVRVELLDGLGHLFFWERPDQVAALVGSFLRD
ncbi:MAG TPA: alpha/beta hydrolase [Actinomadura sp.]|nr:alpha/beta hydrolase [Actinomadura sp.]